MTKMIYKVLLLSILTFLYCGNLVSQQTQYDNIPANLTTGAPSVSIPLWTAGSGSLSLPIYLYYASNGIRLKESPGEVGLSWRLQAGGSITQVVRGLPGNPDSSYFKDEQYLSYPYLDTISKGEKDGEPDLFVINLGQISNQFYFDIDSNIHTLSESNLKILAETNKFTVTDEAGTIYIFGKIQVSQNRTESKIGECSKTWLLTQICSSDKRDTIIIEYDAPPNNYYLSQGKKYLSYATNMNYYSDYGIITETATFVQEIKIKNIITKNETIEFNINEIKDSKYPAYIPYSNQIVARPIGIGYNPIYLVRDKILESIVIKNKQNNEIRRFNFTYHIPNNRIYLESIKEISPDALELPAYQFSYYNTSLLPDIYSKKMDYWGYPNNRDFSNDSLLANYKSRYPDHNFATTGMLKTIKYPSGGTSEYFYEPNTYSFPINPNDQWYDQRWKNRLTLLESQGVISSDRTNLAGPGVRINKIINTESSGALPIITEFGYNENNVSSGRLSYYPCLSYQFIRVYKTGTPLNPSGPRTIEFKSSDLLGLEPGHIIYGKVTVYQGGKINNTENGKNGRIEKFFLQKAPENFGSPEFPFPLNVYDRNYNGMLIKQNILDKDNKLLSTTINTYEYTTNQNNWVEGIKVTLEKQFEYPVFLTKLSFNFYKISQKGIKLINTTSKSYLNGNISDSLINVTEYIYQRNNKEYLKPVEIITTTGNSDVLSTRIYYPEDFTGQLVFNKMIERNILSPVIKKESFKNGIQISGALTNFDLLHNISGDTLLVPINTQNWYAGVYETEASFDKYDFRSGNLLQQHGKDNIYSTTLFAYNSTLPVAKIINMDYQAIAGLINVENLANSSDNTEIESILNALRGAIDMNYPNTFISTTLYNPSIGKTKETDTNGRYITYHYDSLGRLISIKDQNGVIKKYHNYNFAN